MSSQSREGLQRYTPTPAEWASLTIEPVTERAFRAEHVTEGKIAVDEDRSTPVFSPYAGRVTKLLARPGDSVVKGQPLFVIEAADTVQAQNDFIAAMTGAEQGEVGARSGADPGQARQGPVRGQGRSAEGLSAGPGHPDPGAERFALVADGAGSGAQQAAHPRPDRRGDSRRSRTRAASIRRSRSFAPIARHGGAAQDRPRPICQFRRQRSGVRDRRSLHRLAHGLRPRERRRRRYRSGRTSASTCWRCRAAR